MMTGGIMDERKHEQTVKEVGIDNDCICIELLNGLQLMGPLHTKPVHRAPVSTAAAARDPAPALAEDTAAG
jgi:hypothetical protein